jgi:hypothetical protein
MIKRRLLRITKDYYLYMRDQRFFEEQEKGAEPIDQKDQVLCSYCFDPIEQELVFITEDNRAICDQCVKGKYEQN